MTSTIDPLRGGVVPPDVAARVKAHHDELVALRRDLHAHPELSWAEVRTTRLVRERLQAAGLSPRVLPGGTGLVCDIGSGDRVIGAAGRPGRAADRRRARTVPYASTVPGVCHACGHDVHTDRGARRRAGAGRARRRGPAARRRPG